MKISYRNDTLLITSRNNQKVCIHKIKKKYPRKICISAYRFHGNQSKHNIITTENKKNCLKIPSIKQMLLDSEFFRDWRHKKLRNDQRPLGSTPKAKQSLQVSQYFMFPGHMSCIIYGRLQL